MVDLCRKGTFLLIIIAVPLALAVNLKWCTWFIRLALILLCASSFRCVSCKKFTSAWICLRWDNTFPHFTGSLIPFTFREQNFKFPPVLMSPSAMSVCVVMVTYLLQLWSLMWHVCYLVFWSKWQFYPPCPCPNTHHTEKPWQQLPTGQPTVKNLEVRPGLFPRGPISPTLIKKPVLNHHHPAPNCVALQLYKQPKTSINCGYIDSNTNINSISWCHHLIHIKCACK